MRALVSVFVLLLTTLPAFAGAVELDQKLSELIVRTDLFPSRFAVDCEGVDSQGVSFKLYIYPWGLPGRNHEPIIQIKFQDGLRSAPVAINSIKPPDGAIQIETNFAWVRINESSLATGLLGKAKQVIDAMEPDKGFMPSRTGTIVFSAMGINAEIPIKCR